MPFTLCKSEKRRIDELVDHVKHLSDTIEDLRAEVEAIKICTNIASNESLNERRNRAEYSTLHKLKRCLQKNLIPVFSRDPTYKVRKKCQQMFSQMPTIIPRPANLPDNKKQQQFPSSSYAKTDRHSKRPKSSHTKYLDEAGAKRRKQNEPTSSERRKNITNDSPKAEKLHISSSSTQSSKGSLKEPHRVYDPSCTYDTCNSLKTSRKNENLGKLNRDIAKKKTTDAATTTTTSSPKKLTPKQRLIDSETIHRQRSVTFVDRKKKIPHEKDSMISSLSSSNIDYNVVPAKPKTDVNLKRTVNSAPRDRKKKIPLEKDSSMISSLSSSNIDYNVISARPKTDRNLKRTVNSAPREPEVKKKMKKISRSAQCSIDCEYSKKLPVNLKNVHTSTHAYNLSPENKNIAAYNNIIKRRRKGLASKGTQTSSNLWDKYPGEMCANKRRQYCPKAKRSCFSAASQSSLTSCSPRSISSFCLGSEELGEGLMYRYYKRGPNPQKEKYKKKKNTKIRGEETDNVKKASLFSSREPAKKGAKAINMKPRNNRRKRTYLISSDVPVKKTDETGQCNLDEEQENSSSDGMSTFQESELEQRKIAKKWKKHDGLLKVSDGHQLQNKQPSFPGKHDNYMRTSVCTNSQTERFVPKLKRRSNWTVQERRKEPTRLTKLPENTSSSSYACTDETCSLTSIPQINRSDESVDSERFNRNKKATKNFNNTFAHL